MRRIACLLCATLGACDAGSATSIYTPDITSIELHDMGGGFIGQPPPGCDVNTGTETLDVTGRSLTWDRCVVVGTAPNQTAQISSGTHAITDGEWSALLPKLEALSVVDDYSFCGVDRDQMIVTVKSPTATTDYSDSWHACQNRNKPLLDYRGIDDLDSALIALMPPT